MGKILYWVDTNGENNVNVGEFFATRVDDAKKYYNDEFTRLKNKLKDWEKDIGINNCSWKKYGKEITLCLRFYESEEE